MLFWRIKKAVGLRMEAPQVLTVWRQDRQEDTSSPLGNRTPLLQWRTGHPFPVGEEVRGDVASGNVYFGAFYGPSEEHTIEENFFYFSRHTGSL